MQKRKAHQPWKNAVVGLLLRYISTESSSEGVIKTTICTCNYLLRSKMSIYMRGKNVSYASYMQLHTTT